MNNNISSIEKEIEEGVARVDKMLKRLQAFKIIGAVVFIVLIRFLFLNGFSTYQAVSAEKTITAHSLLTGTALAFQNETATQQIVQLTEAIHSTATQRAKDSQATATTAFFRVYATRTERAARTQTILTKRANEVMPILEAIKTLLRKNNLDIPNDAILKSGPKDGNLEHKDDGFVESINAGIASKNFIANVQFENPYSASKDSWDYGLLFRDTDADKQYRLAIFSDSTWILTLRDNEQSYDIDSGSLSNLNTGDKQKNIIYLVVYDTKGYIFINQEYAASFDLSKKMISGDIVVATGIYSGDEINGETTRFYDFTVWSLP